MVPEFPGDSLKLDASMTRIARAEPYSSVTEAVVALIPSAAKLTEAAPSHLGADLRPRSLRLYCPAKKTQPLFAYAIQSPSVRLIVLGSWRAFFSTCGLRRPFNPIGIRFAVEMQLGEASNGGPPANLGAAP